MRVALFSEVFMPKVDGVVTTLRYLLDHLALRGHTSVLFAPEGGPNRYARTVVWGLHGVSCPFYPELKLVPPSVDLRVHLDTFRPDLIHVFNPFSLGVAGLRQAHRLKVPIVASYHTDVPGYAKRWGLGLLRSPLWAYVRWLHSQADLNLCPSRTTLADLTEQGIPRVKIWTRGVDTKRFTPDKRTEAWRWQLSQGDPDAPLLLYVGRLSVEKRVELLRPVLDALPHARLVIVGDGPSRPALESLFAGTRTIFTGYLLGDDLANAYAAADVFVFPSANETLGNVVLEAMASGLPVIAPASGGVLEHVIPGDNGLLFARDDVVGLVSAAQQLTAEPAYAAALGVNGRARALGQTWSNVLDGLLDDYRAVLDRQPMEQAA
ncbi:MAG: glycosyltransferase family 1 protein [Anaerolineae bacterium]